MSTDGFRLGFANVVAAIRGTLADAVNAGAISALNFLKLSGLPSPFGAFTAGEGVATAFISELYDGAQTTSGTIKLIPARPGRLFMPWFSFAILEPGFSGTPTTNGTGSAGNNVAENNYALAAALAATGTGGYSLAVAGGAKSRMSSNAFGTFQGSGASANFIDLATPVTIKITTAVTGTGTLVLPTRAVHVGVLVNA